MNLQNKTKVKILIQELEKIDMILRADNKMIEFKNNDIFLMAIFQEDETILFNKIISALEERKADIENKLEEL